MKQLTKVIYVAEDGTEFNTKEECCDYERNTTIKAFYVDNRNNLIETTDYEKAQIIYFPIDENYSKYNHIMEKFLEKYEDIFPGVDKKEDGWYYYDEFDESYHWISEDIIEPLYMAYRKMFP